MGLCFSVAANEVIYTDKDGNELKTSDLTSQSGTANWKITSNSIISEEAQRYHAEARNLGSQGKYKESLALLEKAMNNEPNWPYPIYDKAYTHLLMGDYQKALEYYRKVDELSPRDFFTTKTAMYTLEGESKGLFPKGLYMAYLSQEWSNETKQRAAFAYLVVNIPNFAPGWLKKSQFTEDDSLKLAEIDQGLSANPDPETYGLLMINKALTLYRNGEEKEATKILAELSMDKDATIATEQMAKESLLLLL